MINKYLNFLNENKGFSKYNKIIDYTYLKQNIKIDKIKEICNDAMRFKFYSVCIRPEYVSYAKNFLNKSDVKICTVISFPKGTNPLKDKIKESEKAIINGADELDVVMNYNLIKKYTNTDNLDEKTKYLNIVKEELYKISELCHGINSVILKVIIETGDLTYEQIKIACDICTEVGVDYVKTSTGTVEIGAEVDKIQFMRKILPDSIKIKASGGIRTLEDIQKFVKHGADRIGTSSNPNIIGRY